MLPREVRQWARVLAAHGPRRGRHRPHTANTARLPTPLVAKHGSRLVKTTGDSVLLEFPSVVDAVKWTVAVQVVMAERNTGVPESRRMLYRTSSDTRSGAERTAATLGAAVNL
jgi:class 3 adenylate cyclase